MYVIAILALLTCLGINRITFAQEIAEADVRVKSIEIDDNISGEFTCKVMVDNIKAPFGDDARGTVLQILLPVGVDVRRTKIYNPDDNSIGEQCIIGPGFYVNDKNTRGYVTCMIGHLAVHYNQEKDEHVAVVSVTTDAPPDNPKIPRTCGALVWNSVPDRVPGNNHLAKP